MTDFAISKIESIDVYTLRNVLASSQLTDLEKAKFIRKNSSQINTILKLKLDSTEYHTLMENRPLIKFRPFVNSFTKRGDKVLLAKALDISTPKVDKFLENVANSLRKMDGLEFVTPDQLESLKVYAYRHGSVEQLVAFLGYELSSSKNITKTLHKTLEYNNGGVADYFVRPIHRMSNKTLVKLYNVVDKSLLNAQQSGNISESEAMAASQWALKQIYEIQNNSKLINAIKTYKL